MGISCQRNGHWPAANHLPGCGLVQPIKELSSVAGWCARRGCALIRQLANSHVVDRLWCYQQLVRYISRQLWHTNWRLRHQWCLIHNKNTSNIAKPTQVQQLHLTTLYTCLQNDISTKYFTYTNTLFSLALKCLWHFNTELGVDHKGCPQRGGRGLAQMRTRGEGGFDCMRMSQVSFALRLPTRGRGL